MLKFGFEPFETMATLPLAAPALVGANMAVNVTLWFGVRITGTFNPLIGNPVPDTLA